MWHNENIKLEYDGNLTMLLYIYRWHNNNIPIHFRTLQPVMNLSTCTFKDHTSKTTKKYKILLHFMYCVTYPNDAASFSTSFFGAENL
jgi:hypothetical protein